MLDEKKDIDTAMPVKEQPETANAQGAAQQEKTADLPKTRGEKFYDVFQFFAGKVFIIGVTALLAFTADQKYAPEKIGGVPNYLKKFQGWFHKVVFHNKIYPVAEKGDTAKLIGGGLVGTMILSHGGNFFAPFIKWLENSREDISNWYNKQYGTPEEVQIAHERLKDIPKQNWADVAKGRVLAWGTVFASMVGAYVGFGKDKNTNRYHLDRYEDAFARKLAGLTKSGKEIGKIPISQALSEAHQANGYYRFGKVLALDLYATTAGIVIWNFFSRLSAKNRTLKEEITSEHREPEEFVFAKENMPAVEAGAGTSFRDKVSMQPKIEPQNLQGFADAVQNSSQETTQGLAV